MTYKPKPQQKSNPYNLKTTGSIITNILMGVRTVHAPSWVGPYLPNKSKMSDGGHPEFRKNASSQWIHMSVSHLVGRCIAAIGTE